MTSTSGAPPTPSRARTPRGLRGSCLCSSVSAYGIHADLPDMVDEDVYPRGNLDRFYYRDKAEAELYAEWWRARHEGMDVCALRPCFVYGPSVDNPAVNAFTASIFVATSPRVGGVQILHERDLAEAFRLAATRPLSGTFNVTTRDRLTIAELAEVHGQRVLPVPERPARRAADALYALRLLPFSGHYVASGEACGDPGRFEAATGWRPLLSTRENAHIMALHRGRSINSSRALRSRAAAESALAPATAAVRRTAGREAELRAALRGLEHVLLPTDSAELHAELHRGGPEACGTVLVVAGPGAHARLYTRWAAAAARSGLNVLVVDPPGHGLSTGRRGHAPPELLQVTREGAELYAAEHLTPVVATTPLPTVPRRGPLAVPHLVDRAPLPLERALRILAPGTGAAPPLGDRRDPLVCRALTVATAAGWARLGRAATARALKFADPLTVSSREASPRRDIAALSAAS